MKVTHITTVHDLLDVRIFQRECKFLKENGYEVTIIAQNRVSTTIEGINIVGLPATRSRLKRMSILTFRAFLRALKENSDVYHIHDPELIIMRYLLKIFNGFLENAHIRIKQ